MSKPSGMNFEGRSMTGVKETLCSSCGHLQVCSFKHDFLLVREEIDRLSINTEDGRIIRVIDIPHFSTSLKCTHWTSIINTRNDWRT